MQLETKQWRKCTKDRDIETFIKNEQRQHWMKSIEMGTTWEEKTWLQNHEAVLDLSQNLFIV